jgi:EAL domain-containing protein (putative c-di-GMP-specific phosphodiesterase class I)/CHASE2 domain-containing sensor protein
MAWTWNSLRGASPRAPKPTRTAPTLAVMGLVGLLFGLVGMGEIAEDFLRVARNRMMPANASGEVVLVAIDERSQREVGAWPWSRTQQAALVDRLDQAGARRILLDMAYDYSTRPADDAALAAAFARSGKVVLPVRLRSGAGGGEAVEKRPIPAFERHVALGTIDVFYNYQMAVWRMNYATATKGRQYPSFAAMIAGERGAAGNSFPIDYRYRMDSIARLSVADVMAGRVAPQLLRGKSVIVGYTSPNLGDQFAIPGWSREGGVLVHVYAAETLLQGRPVDLGWTGSLLAALLFAGLALRAPRTRFAALALGGGMLLLLAAPLLSEPRHWFLDITPGLFVLLVTGATLARRRFRARGFVNATSGLPNLDALRRRRQTRDRALIVARLINYRQLAATLGPAEERALVEQVVARLGVGTPNALIYQGDEGIFAWLSEPGIAVGHHVEALHSLFRSPARIGPTNYDLAVSFGVEIGSARAIGNRLSSALVAADEAAAEGLKWKYHDPERMKDAGWRLSLLARLDEAIEAGEVWVAYQPQIDLASGRFRGAEALARWTHPEKGPISPNEFIAAAEQHGRIDRLTLFMLDRAIEAAARINARGTPFDIAVNLSARTLSRRTLPAEVRGLLERHGLDPRRLTLELTETAALASDGSDLDPLLRLRDLGVKLSIDDYGTGLSTLEYLKKVPANEIKIDQGFIKAMLDNRSDLVMVQSTIALAHSLGRTVVAEGVETRATLDALAEMKCDVAQGYLIGRPTSYDGLVRRLAAPAARGRAA